MTLDAPIPSREPSASPAPAESTSPESAESVSEAPEQKTEAPPVTAPRQERCNPPKAPLATEVLSAGREAPNTLRPPADNNVVEVDEGATVVTAPSITLPCPDGVLMNFDGYLPCEGVRYLHAVYVHGEKKPHPENNALTIFPTEPGEQEVELFYLHKGNKCSKKIRFLINQDPKKLWEKHDPPCAAPFPKPSTDTQTFQDGRVAFVAASRRGRSHEHAGSFRDDDMGFWHDSEKGVYLLVVADGAGSAKYSREGSRLAVESCIAHLAPLLSLDAVWAHDGEAETKDGKVAQLLVSGAYHASSSLASFCRAENDKPQRAEMLSLRDFNTTLLMAAVKAEETGAWRVVSLSIGDGAIAWAAPGAPTLLCSPDGGEYGGQTLFLTTPSVWPKGDAGWEAFRHARTHALHIPAENVRGGFLALMTDGVSDPFFETDAGLRDPKRWEAFARGEADVDDGPKTLEDALRGAPEAAAERLLAWLGFWSRGNHDDRTLAVLRPTAPGGASEQRSPHAQER